MTWNRLYDEIGCCTDCGFQGFEDDDNHTCVEEADKKGKEER